MTEDPHIIGVRFRNSTNVAFFTVDDSSLETGAWVEVPTPAGVEPARIVIAPGQVVLYEPDGHPAPIVRVLTHDEVEKIGEPRFREEPAVAFPVTGPGLTDGHCLLGGPGYLHGPGTGESVEDDLYRQAKAGLPLPGQVVRTGEGDGCVVGIDVFRKLVTIRYHDPERDVTIPASDVLCGND